MRTCNKVSKITLGLITLLAVVASPALAADQNITPDAIFGSGNANGAWTVTDVGSLEIGLRAKLRYDLGCSPDNIFNSNNDGTYSFDAGVAPDGPGGLPDCSGPNRPIWNFEWSVNTDSDDTSGLNVDAYTYELGMDFDPSTAAAYCTFDPITQPCADHSFGDNATANGMGVEQNCTTPTAAEIAGYAALASSNNVVQQSWTYDFFDGAPCGPFDPNLDATYDIYLRVLDASGNEVGRSSIAMDIGAGGPEPLPASNAFGMIVLFAGLLLVTTIGIIRFRAV